MFLSLFFKSFNYDIDNIRQYNTSELKTSRGAGSDSVPGELGVTSNSLCQIRLSITFQFSLLAIQLSHGKHVKIWSHWNLL